MPQEVILLKLGEIALKGLNRRSFEDVLLKNIRRRLQSAGEFSVSSRQSTVYVVPENPQADLDLAEERVSKVFGVVGYARAGVCEKELDAICRRAAEYLAEELDTASTFKVECKRSDKKFPYKSPEVGTGGKAAVLISGGLDSPVAAWMMARRGVELTAVHFASPPYTSELAREKVKRLLQKVAAYAGRVKFITVNFTHLQEEIRDKCPEELSTVILRRFMLRAAERVARDEGCAALVTGESLGQVASQTIQAIACTDAVASLPVFRPLIGTDKSEIVELARRIDTFDISIEPFEDCCTIFTPKHPRTKPILHFVESGEEAIDGAALLEEALRNLETEWVYPQ